MTLQKECSHSNRDSSSLVPAAQSTWKPCCLFLKSDEEGGLSIISERPMPEIFCVMRSQFVNTCRKEKQSSVSHQLFFREHLHKRRNSLLVFVMPSDAVFLPWALLAFWGDTSVWQGVLCIVSYRAPPLAHTHQLPAPS